MQPAMRRLASGLTVLLAGMILLGWCTRARAADSTTPPGVPAGSIVRLDRFPSQYVAPHDVGVWLPPGYPEQAPYAVLYMFDGQNLFGKREPGKMQSWNAAATAARLIAAGKTRPFIIVGIWNAQNLRMSEYFPQKPWESLTPGQRRTLFSRELGTFQILPVAPYSDAFLRFVTQELKPTIDHRFAVDPESAATFVMGSSMGGLMAWYAMSEYPEVFGGAACLSTYWPGPYLSLDAGSDDPAPDAFVDYIRGHFPTPAGHKVYFDRGTRTLDAFIGPTQQRVDRVLKAKGWTGSHFESRVFPGAEHSEKSWAARLAIPMTFLLAPASR
jgi:enterochelin esterase-like enzyme